MVASAYRSPLVMLLLLQPTTGHFRGFPDLVLFSRNLITVAFSYVCPHFLLVMGSSTIGFLVQGSSCCAESGKIIVQAMLLAGPDRKLDPLSYVLTVSPLCAGLLGLLLASQAMLATASPQ